MDYADLKNGWALVTGAADGIGFALARSFAEGFLDRISDPMDRAASHIFVNTERTKRRMTELFTEFGPTLLPQIHTLSQLANDPLNLCSFNSSSTSLSDRLELARLIRGLLSAKPELASSASIYELADSLYALMDEAHGERVELADLAGDGTGKGSRNLGTDTLQI